jgi:hypothetical protein
VLDSDYQSPSLRAQETRVAKGGGEMECGAADARRSFELGQFGGLLAGRKDAGVSIARQDRQAAGR